MLRGPPLKQKQDKKQTRRENEEKEKELKQQGRKTLLLPVISIQQAASITEKGRLRLGKDLH